VGVDEVAALVVVEVVVADEDVAALEVQALDVDPELRGGAGDVVDLVVLDDDVDAADDRDALAPVVRDLVVADDDVARRGVVGTAADDEHPVAGAADEVNPLDQHALARVPHAHGVPLVMRAAAGILVLVALATDRAAGDDDVARAGDLDH